MNPARALTARRTRVGEHRLARVAQDEVDEGRAASGFAEPVSAAIG